jgi:hypothetical protein
MLRVAEYLQHAKECRAMAQQTSIPAHRDQLIKMAETWEQLGETRRRQLKKWGNLQKTESSE